MASQDFKRKLTAIFSADVKEYSRLMREDEEATVRTITAYRELIGSVVRKHRGEVVDSPGDNILAEFASVVDAVRSAVEVQEELKARNAELPENRRMEFRIGINLGDVIHEKERIYGDGVNVAARVESLADAGGICVSRSAYDQVKDKLTLGYEYLGEHSVKNIAEPVRVYKVLMEPEYAGKVLGEEISKTVKWPRTATAALVVLTVVTCALIVWNFYIRRPSIEPASIEKMAFPLPDKPSIAVLSFDNLSGDPEQEYFSDGLTDQIINGLSNVPDLFVIARNSTFAYKGKPVKVQKVAEDLGVKYVLEGSVQKTANRVRITTQLIDATTGHHIWSERYDRNLEDIFAIQDDITMEIMAALRVKLTVGTQADLKYQGTKNIGAYEKYLKSRHHLFKRTKEDVRLGQQFAQEAIDIDPKYAAAYRMMGWLYLDEVWFGMTKSPAKSIEKAEQMAQKAISLKSYQAPLYRLLSSINLLKKNLDDAVEYSEKAVELGPNDAAAHFTHGMALRYNGQYKEAISKFEKAIRLNPSKPINYLNNLGWSYLLAKDYESAILVFNEAIQRNPDYLFAYMGISAAYELSGDKEKSQWAAKNVLRINPKFSLLNYEKRSPIKIAGDKNRIINAMRNTGLPDTPPLPLPDKPSIAVLPFDNMSDDPKQEYFSDGITEDLITDLSKISGLFVIARNSTFTYKGKPVKVQQVARELGVRYVLEGSVRKAGGKVRLNAQLVDATTGHHLWAERFDGTFGDIFALQDRFTRKIVTALALKLTEGEQKNLTLKYTDNVEAYDAYLKGREHFFANTRDDLVKAVGYFEKAIELDPNYSPAHAGLASTYQTSISRALNKELGWLDVRSRVRKHLQIAMKNPTPYAHYAVAKTRLYQRKYDEAIAEAERCISLDPNYPDCNLMMGWILTFAGRSAEAIDHLKRAMRLNPHFPGFSLYSLGLAQYFLGQYEEAAASLERSLKFLPDSGPWPLAITYAQLGRGQEAADILAKYFEKRGWWGSPIEDTFKYWPIKEQKDLDHWADGLRKSGLMRPWNPVYRREYEKAIADADQAITLNPNDAKAQYAMGESLVFAGRSAEAVDYLEKAMSLNPKYPANYLFALGLAQFCQEKYEEAASSLERALYELKMGGRPVMWLLAATYAHLGRQQKAHEVLTEYMKKRGYKGYTVERVLKMYLHAFKDPKDTERFAEGLHKAGLPME